VLARAYAVNVNRISLIDVRSYVGMSLPSTKTKGEGLHVVPDATFRIKPALWIERFRIWEGDGIARDSPEKNAVNGMTHIMKYNFKAYQWHP
jgi:hypothetical protein